MYIKRLLFLVLALILTLAPAAVLTGPRSLLDQPITIWTATDLHYIAPSLSGDYFAVPASGGDGKAVFYADEATEALLDQARRERPDLLILSGDLTLNGAEQSHRELVEKLTTLQNSGVQVLTLAGNHDVEGVCADYTTFDGQRVDTAPSLTAQQYRELYAPFGWDQAISRDGESFSYVYEVHPRLRILMLDTNCAGKGYVQYSTLRWVEAQLREARFAGAKVIGVSHQNLYAHNSLLSFGYQMYNAQDLLPVYERGNLLCNLSGHVHVQSIVEGKVPEIATGSLIVAGCRFGRLVYDGRSLTYDAQSLDDRQLAADVRWYFEEVARKQTYGNFTEGSLSEEQIDLLAETFAAVNSAYFAGESIDEGEHAEGIAFWRQQGSFVSQYLETMLEAGKRDNLHIEIR